MEEIPDFSIFITALGGSRLYHNQPHNGGRRFVEITKKSPDLAPKGAWRTTGQFVQRDAPLDFRVTLLKDAAQDENIRGSKAVGEPPLMLALSVREALRAAIFAFGNGDSFLPSPLTPEAIKMAIGELKRPHIPSAT